MPTLTWASKSSVIPSPAALETDSIVYPQGAGYPDSIAENQLILGDNLAGMSAILPQFLGKVNLIYTDPPFFTNKHYPARIGRGEDSRRPQEWQLAEGYQDHWSSVDAYLDMLYPRLKLMHELLSSTGTLYLHLDWHASAYARLLLDEIFGADRLLNEIVWVYHGPSPIRSAFNRKHDTILVYTKGNQYTFNVDQVRQPYDPSTVKTFAASPKAGFGKVPDLKRGKVPEDWWYFPVVARLHSERSGYPTQKPEALLERIIRASSNPGDWVADFFCGSGTTPVVAARLGRKFIGSDISFRAIHTTRGRLVQTKSDAFSIQRVKDGMLTRDKPEVAWQYKLSVDGKTVKLEADNLDEVDYWEIDPAWDEKVFRSAAQATRLPRQTRVREKLELADAIERGKLCARVVNKHGEWCTLH